MSRRVFVDCWVLLISLSLLFSDELSETLVACKLEHEVALVDLWVVVVGYELIDEVALHLLQDVYLIFCRCRLIDV